MNYTWMKLKEQILIFATLYISLASTFSQIPDFDISPTEGCDSLEVTFVNKSTAPGLSDSTWIWDFGDGSNYVGQPRVGQPRFITPPSKKYFAKAGDYAVRLTINGITSAPKIIKVKPSPYSLFTYSFITTDSGFNYTFSAPLQILNDSTYSYQWLINGDTLFGENVNYFFNVDSVYSVQLLVEDTLPNGCSSLASRELYVSKELQIPNVFTPNGDTFNDVFLVQTDGNTQYLFKVYTRVGVLVYKTESPSIIWDGRLASGEDAIEGTYFYVIESLNGTIKKEAKGFIVLYR